MTDPFKNLIFKGDALYDGYVSNSKMICHIKNGVLYKGALTSRSYAVALVKDGKIYDGDMAVSRNLKGHLKGEAVYAGSIARNNSVVLMQKGYKLYLGNIPKISAEIGRIKGTEDLDLATYTALIHYFISPILNL